MLQSLHKTSTGLFARTLLFILVAALGLWGIGDIFRSAPSGSIAKVGSSKITPYEFQREFAKEQDNFRRMLGNNYSNELLKSLNVPQQVLTRLIQRHLIQNETHALGIAVPDSYVKKMLKDNPAFHGEDGQFDATLFRSILADNRMNEEMYVQMLHEDVASRMLMETLFSESSAPTKAIDLLFQHMYEKRVADVLVLPASLIQNIPEPSEEQLKTFFEASASQYTAPELRTFTALVLDFKKISDAINISDDELLIAYQERVDEYHQPETREVEQLIFTDKETAEKALNALKAGSPITDVKTNFTAVNDEISLGTVTAQAMLPEAEKPVFLAKEGSYTDPVESTFGWHVFHVKAVNAARTQPLSEVHDALLESLKTERADKEIYELSTRVGDDIAAGTSLKDIAKNLSLQTLAYGPLQKSGKAADGTDVKLPEGMEPMLQTAFEIDESKTSDLKETPNGSFYAVQVDKLMPERTKALDEIRATVVDDWKKAERASRLEQLARGIASKLAEENIQDVAKATGGHVLAAQTLSRSSTKLDGDVAIPPVLLGELFNLKKGAATAAYPGAGGTAYLVAKLTDVQSADSKEAGSNPKRLELGKEIATQYQEEIFQQYLAYLQAKHGVSDVNSDVLNKLLPE